MGEIRIIGGAYRGRKISVLEHAQLRPTGDRMRETLFNWLGQDLTGQRCLDLFAGTGILGFEALSRGARWVTFVEKNRPICQRLVRNREVLTVEKWSEVVLDDANVFLDRPKDCYDIVFVDPPFHREAIDRLLLKLKPWIRPTGKIYIETEKGLPLPTEWVVEKEKTTRQACGRLIVLME